VFLIYIMKCFHLFLSLYLSVRSVAASYAALKFRQHVCGCLSSMSVAVWVCPCVCLLFISLFAYWLFIEFYIAASEHIAHQLVRLFICPSICPFLLFVCETSKELICRQMKCRALIETVRLWCLGGTILCHQRYYVFFSVAQALIL